jgi:SAM-dependent methyltransferase
LTGACFNGRIDHSSKASHAEPPRTEALGLPFACPACGGPLQDPAATHPCPECGFEIVVEDSIPVLVSDRERIADEIAAARRAPGADWYEGAQATMWTGPYRHHVRKRLEYLRSALGRFRPAGGYPVALDLGCGDGEHLGWLRAHVGDLYGSDYNLLRLRRAAEKGAARLVVMADLTDYPAADGSFDLVFCHHVIEHVPKLDAALAEIRRILRPGGIALIGTPNEGAGFWRFAYRIQPRTRRITDHVHFFTAATLEEHARRAGLRVLEMERIGWGVPHWGLDARIRGVKAVDDLLETVGRRFAPEQATSLYAVLSR